MNYQLEIKQIVDYPRCRIYREFLQNLMNDKSIRTTTDSYLYFYMVLYSYANYRSSYQRIEGISYLVSPGEWICSLSELTGWFRCRYHHQTISILEYLQTHHYITYCRLGRGHLIKFKVLDWKQYNTAFNYNYPCLKDEGFFFFPICAVHELISMRKCSEMDIILDLWIHAIYNDEQVQGSSLGPVVYFRNCTGNPLVSYNDLSKRWNISKATISRLLKRLEERDYLSLVNFTGKHGSVIYLRNYLSTMFQISDVMIDKEEVSMSFKMPVNLPDENAPEPDSIPIREEQISVSNDPACVSKSHIRFLIHKVSQILSAQGIPCCECSRSRYKLYGLSDCTETELRYSLKIECPDGKTSYQFELVLTPDQGYTDTTQSKKGGMD